MKFFVSLQQNKKYMSITEFIQLNNINAYTLYPLGIEGYAYLKEDALCIVKYLRDNSFPITGGDVYTIIKGKICHSEVYSGWFCDRLQDELWDDYVQRSYEITYKYINNYSTPFSLFIRKINVFNISYVESPNDYNDNELLVNKVLAKWNPLNVPQDMANYEYLSYVPYIVDSMDDRNKLRSCLLSILRAMGFDKETIYSKSEGIDKIIEELSRNWGRFR